MKKRIIFRVLPLTERRHFTGWKVTEGRKVLVRYRLKEGYTKTDAVNYARDRAEYCESQLFVHGRDGRIQSEATFPRSSDPRRSRG